MLGKAGGLNDKAGDVVHVIRFQSAPERTKALKAAGGVQPFSPGSETIVIDLRRLILHGAMELNLPIKSGDVIYVPYAQNAYVLGAVNKAGNVPVRENLTATQAVAMVGGINPVLASDDISVVRFDDQGQRLTLSTNLTKVATGAAADIPLKDNDIVFVHESGFRRFFFDFKNMFPGSFGATIPF
jgi:polysaccharide export outer membrane protein